MYEDYSDDLNDWETEQVFQDGVREREAGEDEQDGDIDPLDENEEEFVPLSGPRR